MNHRSKMLRESARHEACVVCGDTGSTVWAHANEQMAGKGTGIKGHDLLGLYLCAEHHAWYDQGKAPRAEKREFFREYYPKTMVRVAEKLAAGNLML